MADEIKTEVTQEAPALLVEKKDHVLYLTMNRPAKYNAMNKEMYAMLYDAIRDYRFNDDLRCCVITGAKGAKKPVFTSGGDLKWFQEERAIHGELWQPHFPAYDEMEKTNKPFIAAVDGMCMASGFNLAVEFCDFIICTERSTFGIPALKRALRLHYPIPYHEQMSLSNALYMVMTGKMMTAQDGLRMGYVQEVVPDDKLDERIKEITDIIVECAPASLSAHKALLKLNARNPGSGQMMCDIAFAPLNSPENLKIAKEGREAFLEKRTAHLNKD